MDDFVTTLKSFLNNFSLLENKIPKSLNASFGNGTSISLLHARTSTSGSAVFNNALMFKRTPPMPFFSVVLASLPSAPVAVVPSPEIGDLLPM